MVLLLLLGVPAVVLVLVKLRVPPPRRSMSVRALASTTNLSGILSLVGVAAGAASLHVMPPAPCMG